MTPDKFRTYGEFLYGDYWMRPLARDIKVNDRTVRRWSLGGVIPERIEAELIDLCAAHYVKLMLLKRPIPQIFPRVKERAHELVDFFEY